MITDFSSEKKFWDIANRGFKEAMDQQVVNFLRSWWFDTVQIDRLENEGGKVNADI